MLSQVTRLLALVSAPPLEAATRPSRRGAAAAAERRDGRRDHVDRRRHEAALLVPRAGRPGPRHAGRPISERAARRARGSARARSSSRFDEPGLGPRERAFLLVIRGAFEQAADEERQLFVGGAAGLLDEMRAEEIGAYRSLMEALEKRAALLDVLAQRARPAPAVRPRRRGARAAGPARARARRRDLRARAPDARRRQPARPAAHGLREGAPLGPLRRARAVPLRRRRLRARTDGDDRPRLLRGARRRPRRRRARRSRRRSAGSRASCIPTSPSEPEAELRFREVTEAYEVLSNSETRALYDRYGHAGLRSGGFPPTHFDIGGLGDLFSAFFGDDVFGGGARRAAAARGADLGAEIEIELVEAARGATVQVPFEVAVTCATCGGDGVEPGTEPLTCARCGGTGRLQQVSRSVFGEFVRTQACPRVPRPRRRSSSTRATTCDGAGRTIEARELEVDIPAGIHDGQRIRLSGEGHAGALGGRAGRRLRARPRHARPALRARGQRHLLAGRPDDRPGGARRDDDRRDARGRRSSSSSTAGTQPGDVRVLRGKGMPVLQGFGRGDHRVLVNVTVPRRAERRAAPPARGVRGGERRDTYRARRGLLRQAEERVPLSRAPPRLGRRSAASVPRRRARP